ncbi:hypothetical protein J6590_017646 [Homalodisca vitripennis]|nr:hypothetical protein J6590_017646 [Homalodisca vitripennis]
MRRRPYQSHIEQTLSNRRPTKRQSGKSDIQFVGEECAGAISSESGTYHQSSSFCTAVLSPSRTTLTDGIPWFLLSLIPLTTHYPRLYHISLHVSKCDSEASLLPSSNSQFIFNVPLSPVVGELCKLFNELPSGMIELGVEVRREVFCRLDRKSIAHNTPHF